MLKITSTNVIPPDVPSSRKSVPTFGTNLVDEKNNAGEKVSKDTFKKSNDCHDCDDCDDKEDAIEKAEKQRKLKQVWKTLALLATGAFTFGTTKYGLNRACEVFKEMVKSKSVKNAVVETVEQQSQNAASSKDASKASNFISKKYLAFKKHFNVENFQKYTINTLSAGAGISAALTLPSVTKKGAKCSQA